MALLILQPITVCAFDPMAPPGYQEIKPEKTIVKKVKPRQPEYILKQIVIRTDNSKSAVINGYVLNEGGYLKGAKVIQITSNQVVLDIAGKEKVLNLKPKVARIRQ